MSKEVTYGFPTHIEKAGELLKICLQKDHKLGLYVESYLLRFLDEIRSARCIPKIEDLYPGRICVGQFDDQQFYRIKVIDHSVINQTVNVLFIDYGNYATLSLSDIRLLSYEHQSLLSIPPLALTCFLEGVNVLKQWNDEELSTLKKFILYEERQCVIRQLTSEITVVNIYIATNNKYLNTMIIENDLGTLISDAKLMILAKGMMPSGVQYNERSDHNRLKLLQQRVNEPQLQQRMNEPQSYVPMNTNFEAVNFSNDRLSMPDSNSMQLLSVGSTNHVYVSHVEDGPYSFFVQLKTNAEDALPRLTNLLKQQKPTLHTPPLMPGCMVMTHVLTDNSYRRSVVMNIRHDSCLVYHMDFGSSEEIPCSEIYQLPPQARHAPAMALRFCLSDLKTQQVSDSAKAYFQVFLEKKCVLIRVVHEEHGNPLYQYCEMFYDNKNVKDILSTFNSPLEYTHQLHPRGKDVKVTVSVVESPAQFFVQYASKLDIISHIQDAVKAYCLSQPRLQDKSSVTIGSPVAALYEDGAWYRAMVVGINVNSVRVLYVDYGNRADVPVNHLCQISRELVTSWRTQAVECCLVGFENCGEISDMIKEKMSDKTLGLTYHLRLISILVSKLLVDLVDNLGGKVSDHITYSPPQRLLPYRDIPPFYQKSKDQVPQTSPICDSTNVDSSEQQKGKPKNENSFIRSFPRQNSFHASESAYSERDVRGDEEKRYNRQKCFDKGPRFKADEGRKKSTDNFEEERPRRGRFSDERSGGRASVGSHGSDDFSEDRQRRGFGGPRSKPDDDKVSDQFNEDRPRRGGGFNRQNREEERGFEQISEDRPRRPYNPRSRIDDDKVSSQFSDDKPRRSFRGQQDDEKGRNFGSGRDRPPRGGDDGSGHDRPPRANDSGGGWRSGRRGDDGDRRGGFSRGGSRWGGGGDGESEDRPPRREGGGRRGGDWKKPEGEEYRGNDRRPGGSGNRRANWNNKEEGAGGGWSGGGDARKKRFDNDFNSSKKLPDKTIDSSPSKTEVSADFWEASPVDGSKAPTVPSSAATEYPMINIKANSELKVHLSYMKNPHFFYVQPDGTEVDLDEIRLITEAESEASLVAVKDFTSLQLGTPVLARFSLDQLLYRGLVQQVFPPSSVQVLFIDYGNSDFVSMGDVFLVSPKLAMKPPVALCCSLNDVSPINGEWTNDADGYTKHFEANDNEALTMNVVSAKMLDGQLVLYVNLTTPSGEQVSQVLAKEGLANTSGKSSAFTPLQNTSDSVVVSSSDTTVIGSGKIKELLPDKWVDRFDLLVGQTFYCEVLETVEENLFVISITEAKVIALTVPSSDQQNISTLPLATQLIIEVKAVLNDRLKVLMFDLNGCLLGSKEETTPRRVSPICPFPVVRRLEHVNVCHSEGSIVYIQRLSDVDKVATLLDDMYEFYEGSSPEPGSKWNIGDICAAKSEHDSNWYRARLISSPKDHTVRYIDYGNTEELPPENLRKLDQKFFSSELCLNVQLSVYWRSPNPPFLEVVEGEELFAKFTRDFNGKWIVDLSFADGTKVIQKLLEKNIASEKTDSPFDDKNTIIGSDLTAGDSVPILVSHDDSVTNFWAQMTKHVCYVDGLQDKLQNIIENLNAGRANELKVFGAQYSEDGIWYRATKVGENMMRFIDYGNTDTICDQIKELPVEMMKPASGFAVPMYLCVEPLNGSWSEEAIQIHQNFIEKPDILAEVINVSYKIIVDLKSEGKLLSELLIKAGLAEYHDYLPDVVRKHLKERSPVLGTSESQLESHNISCLQSEPEVQVTTGEAVLLEEEHPDISEDDKVVIVLAISPNSFYIQEESKLDRVDEIMNRLLSVEMEVGLTKHTGKIEVGQLFAVRFIEDDLLYRAKVISLQPKIEVFLIDYGNIVTASDLRVLPEDVASTPPLAIHCSLDIKETPQLISSFIKITDCGRDPFHVKFKSYGSPHIVSLHTLDGKDVVNILQSVSENSLSLDPELIKGLHISNENLALQTSLKDEIEEGLRITMELLEPELNVVKQGYISHINSIYDFYIQEIAVLSVVDHINDIFSDFDDNKVRKDNFEIGDLVASQYIDGGWYRGVVIQKQPQVIVQFIDYGNEIEGVDVYELPNVLKNLSPVAIRCCLSVNGKNLSQNIEEKFIEISGSGGTLFSFKILSKNGNMNIVELKLDNKNVLLNLVSDKKSSCEEPAVSSKELIVDDIPVDDCKESGVKDDVPADISKESDVPVEKPANDSKESDVPVEKPAIDSKESDVTVEKPADDSKESDVTVDKLADDSKEFVVINEITTSLSQCSDIPEQNTTGSIVKIVGEETVTPMVSLVEEIKVEGSSNVGVKADAVSHSALKELNLEMSPEKKTAGMHEAVQQVKSCSPTDLKTDIQDCSLRINEKTVSNEAIETNIEYADVSNEVIEPNLESADINNKAIETSLESADVGACSAHGDIGSSFSGDEVGKNNLFLPLEPERNDEVILLNNEHSRVTVNFISNDDGNNEQNNEESLSRSKLDTGNSDNFNVRSNLAGNNDSDESLINLKKDVIGSSTKKCSSKPVKTLAEIKASAKPRIVTRSSNTSDKPVKSVKCSPVSKVKSEPDLDNKRGALSVEDEGDKVPLPRAKSLPMDERPLPGSLSQPPSPEIDSRAKQSKGERIVPGAVSGVMADTDQD